MFSAALIEMAAVAIAFALTLVAIKHVVGGVLPPSFKPPRDDDPD